MEWHGDEFIADIKRENNKNLTRVGIYIVNKVKENLSVSSNKGKTPASAGEFPHKDTGRLRAAQTYEVDGESVYVGSNIEYGGYQETGTSKMPAHPYLRPTMIQEGPAIEKLLDKGGK